MSKITRVGNAIRRRLNGRPEVRFHTGPQGQPVPCFDQHCSSPHLGPEDIRLEAG